MRTAMDAWMEVRLEDGTLRASDAGGFHDTNPGLQTLLAFVPERGGSPKGGGSTRRT